MSLERVVSLKIDGEIAKGGRVPIELLAKKLHALQEMLLETAAALRQPVSRKKQQDLAWSAIDPKVACQLRFKSFRINCLTVDTELNPPPEVLIPEALDLGLQTLESAGEGLLALYRQDTQQLERMFPDQRNRNQFLRCAKPLTPEGSSYSIQLQTPSQEIRFDRDVRLFIEKLESEFKREVETDTRLITGEVYAIHIDERPSYVGLKVKGRHLKCFFTSASIEHTLRDDVTVGTLVEVIGRARLTKGRNVSKFESLDSLRVVKSEPIHWSRVVYEDRSFALHVPLEIQAHFDGEGWVFEYEELGLMGFGETRQQAVDAFRMDFAATWDRIAQAPDERLTTEARRIKKGLLGLVPVVGVPE